MDFRCSTYVRICFISTRNLKRKTEMSLVISLISGMPHEILEMLYNYYTNSDAA